jgi:GTP cyclohydrolase I
MLSHDAGKLEALIAHQLELLDPQPDREGLKETPHRVRKAWEHWTNGYGVDPTSILKTFEDGAEKYDEMVFQGNVPVYSHCEHHLAPFFGVAHIAYIPNKRIVGLSKISRLVDVFAHRLQVQERLTTQIADCLHQVLEPMGVGVVIRCRHLCMESRGIQRQGTVTYTSSLQGVFRGEAKSEFMRFVERADADAGNR